MLPLLSKYQGKLIAISVLAAFILALMVPHLFINLLFISTAFINLLKLCALPIILTSLIITIGNLPHLSQLRQVAFKSIVYIIFTELVAVSISLIAFNLVEITQLDVKALLNGAHYTGAAAHIDPGQIINYLFPSNIFQALVNFEVLPIVFFSIMLGITCSLNSVVAQPLLTLLTSTREVFLQLLKGIMYLAPIAIFVMVGNSVAESYLSGSLTANLIGLLKFVALFLIALFIHCCWQLGLVLALYRQLSLRQILTQALPSFTTAFVSSSSLAALPLSLEKAVVLGGKRKVVNFMLPICASMNFASGMMYEMAACLFFMHLLGVHPGLGQQLLLAVACILTGIAVGGIPETSMVSFVPVFGLAHIPLAAIAILMPLDRILDRIRTMVNVFGNTCGTLVVSKIVDD